MVIIDTFYHLIERDTKTISIHWKALQVIGFISASVTGFVSAIWFYKALQGFSMNCILYPDIVFKALPPGHQHINILPENMTIDGLLTEWNRDILCQYSISVWVISFIGGAIFATFFIVSPKGGKGYSHSPFTQPWKMMCPMTLLCLLMCILTGVAVVSTAGGMNNFCSKFQNFTNATSCTDVIDLYTLKYNDDKVCFNNSRKIVQSCASVSWIAWIISLLILLVRMCLAPDFQLQVINIKPAEKGARKSKAFYPQPSLTVLQRHRNLRIEQLISEDNSKSTQKPDDDFEIHYV